MSQRGITGSMLDVVLRFGIPQGDRIHFGRKAVDAALKELDELRRQLLKVRDKGGLVVVEEGGILLTTYRLDSFDRKKAMRKSRYGKPVPTRARHEGAAL
jgi:hypothetical protein